jgi:hypothetical protein
MKRPPAWQAVLVLACGLAAGRPAAAHDSWLAALPAARGSAFGLSTGARYPVAEVAPPVETVADAGCVDAQGRRQPLRPLEVRAAALRLQTEAAGPLGCWIALQPVDVTLTPQLVAVYLREIQPPGAVARAWAAQQADGLAWVERYRKFARVEHGVANASPSVLRELRAPLGLPLEIVVEGDAPLRAGEVARFRVLSDGQPVAGLSVELVSERSRFGVWARSDAQGVLQHRLPFEGAWLLRATLLEGDVEPGHWRSRFATLAFEVEPSAVGE